MESIGIRAIKSEGGEHISRISRRVILNFKLSALSKPRLLSMYSTGNAKEGCRDGGYHGSAHIAARRRERGHDMQLIYV